ncbi:MAG: homoserine O-acetyltransferase [Acidobacteria bacterium]|nr:homoserine O-acetyltransferase [Acidobacteriota bacterium]
MTQQAAIFPEFVFESGVRLRDVPVAYHTWGSLNAAGDNAVLVCHSLTSTSDAHDWWPALFGEGRALDPTRHFVVCANAIGSPYGTLSPLSVNPESGEAYGPDFPVPTVRDTVALHRMLLDRLGVRRVLYAIGGSMGGMQALEWAFQDGFVQGIVPIGVGGRHSAWCIAWSEVQRQAIYRDPAWRGGHYRAGEGPVAGLGVARMIAMISYRSFASFEDRFGRVRGGDDTAPYAMETYLHHQGTKLVERFDANCYVRLTESMDTHDVSRGRGEYREVLGRVDQPALVIGIDSDVLYPLEEQRELARGIPRGELAVLEAPHGHDSFLIEVATVNEMVVSWLKRTLEPVTVNHTR